MYCKCLNPHLYLLSVHSRHYRTHGSWLGISIRRVGKSLTYLFEYFGEGLKFLTAHLFTVFSVTYSLDTAKSPNAIFLTVFFNERLICSHD